MQFAIACGVRLSWPRSFAAKALRKISLHADASEQSAIDEVIAAGAEPCLVRRQKRGQLSDLFSSADTSQRMRRAESRERLFGRQLRREVCRGACQHGCADRARADRIDANIVGGMV